MKKINPPTGSIEKLTEEFKVSRTTVYQALAYNNNSDTALKIRKRAKELLAKELEGIERIEATTNNF